MTGPLAGKSLKVLPAENTTWGDWKTFQPRTRVLSFATGIQRDYSQDPYAAYPLSRAPALLVVYRGSVKIYPFSELKKQTSPLVDTVGGREIRITYDRLTQTGQVENRPSEVTAFVAFFDDLKAFYPDAEIYHRRRR